MASMETKILPWFVATTGADRPQANKTGKAAAQQWLRV